MDDTDISWNMCLTFAALNYDGSSYLNMGWEGNIGSNFIITYGYLRLSLILNGFGW